MGRINVVIYREEARTIQDVLNLKDGDEVTVETSIDVSYKSIEGRPRITLGIHLKLDNPTDRNVMSPKG